jgi:spore germination protein KC
VAPEEKDDRILIRIEFQNRSYYFPERREDKVNAVKMSKKVIAIFIIITTTLSTTSCGVKVDVQNLAVIMAMGVDFTDEGKYRVSYQLLNSNPPQAGSGLMGESSGSSGGLGVVYFEGLGETVIEAMFNMGSKISRKLHFGQLKVLVIGEKAAESGIAPIVDAMGRFSEIKTNLPVYATKGEAGAIVRQSSSENTIPANTIDEMTNRQVLTGGQPVVYLAHLVDKMASEFGTPILGVIVIPKSNGEPSGGSYKMDGIAVFDKDRLVGYLDEKKTLAYQYIKGKVKLASISVRRANGHKVALGILESKSKLATSIVSGEPQVIINIMQKSYLREASGDIDFVKNPEVLEELAKLQEDVVRKNIQETIDAAMEDLKVDFIGMGEAIYRQHPRDFEKIKDAWKDRFLDLNIKVYVNAEIKETGLLSKPVQ